MTASGALFPVGDVLAVETRGLTKRFPPQPSLKRPFQRRVGKLALDDVTLAIPQGEIFGLIGPNGAGKTTLIKILCGLILPSAGTAQVAGFDVQVQEQEVRRRIGLVYSDARSFFWRLTLRENLRFYAALGRTRPAAARSRIEELAELVGLTYALDTRMHFFSSGMKQRAAIARGLITEPPIVFLDEPTAMVDPVAAHDLRQMIRERVLEDGRRTVFLTTNVMGEAEALCDRVALLRQGRVEMVGGVDILRQQFQPYEHYLLSVGNVSVSEILELRSVAGVHALSYRAGDAGLLDVTLEVQRDSRAIPDCIGRLTAASAAVWQCSPQRLSLDEMFRLAFGREPRSPNIPQTPPGALLKTA